MTGAPNSDGEGEGRRCLDVHRQDMLPQPGCHGFTAASE